MEEVFRIMKMEAAYASETRIHATTAQKSYI
jgi:hypothetical protein